eukprot:g17503.t1
MNEFRPGVGDSRSLSASQAADLERRFNRLKEEQMAERAARENVNRFEDGKNSPSPRRDEDTNPARACGDHSCFFVTAPLPLVFSGEDNDSDSDRSVGRGSGSKAPPSNIDLLDMDAEEPARTAPAAQTVGEDWADFCTPATSSTPVPRFEGPPSRMQPTSTGSNDLMDRDLVDAPSNPPPGQDFTAFDSSDNFFEADFKSAQPSAMFEANWTSGQASGDVQAVDRSHMPSGYVQPPQPAYTAGGGLPPTLNKSCETKEIHV